MDNILFGNAHISYVRTPRSTYSNVSSSKCEANNLSALWHRNVMSIIISIYEASFSSSDAKMPAKKRGKERRSALKHFF